MDFGQVQTKNLCENKQRLLQIHRQVYKDRYELALYKFVAQGKIKVKSIRFDTHRVVKGENGQWIQRPLRSLKIKISQDLHSIIVHEDIQEVYT